MHNPSSSSPAHLCHRRSQVSPGGPRAGTSNSKGLHAPAAAAVSAVPSPPPCNRAPVTGTGTCGCSGGTHVMGRDHQRSHGLRALCPMLYFNKMFALEKVIFLCLLSVFPFIRMAALRQQERNPGARTLGEQGRARPPAASGAAPEPSKPPSPTPGFPRASSLCRAPPGKTHPCPRVHLCTQKSPPGSRDHGARWGPRLWALPTGFKARPHPPLSQVQTSPLPHAPFMWFPSNLKTPPPRGLCTRGRFLQSPFEKPGASQAQISPVQSACLHRPPMRRGREGVQTSPGSTEGVASTFSGPATAPSKPALPPPPTHPGRSPRTSEQLWVLLQGAG